MGSHRAGPQGPGSSPSGRDSLGRRQDRVEWPLSMSTLVPRMEACLA